MRSHGVVAAALLLSMLPPSPGSAGPSPSASSDRVSCTIIDRESKVVVGSASDDVICAGDQGAIIIGLLGNDTIVSGRGDDVIVGGDGSDRVDGGGGNDVIEGGLGDDTCVAAAATDCEHLIQRNAAHPDVTLVDVSSNLRSAYLRPPDSFVVTYDGPQQIQPGDVLTATVTEKTPHGLLARSVSVEERDGVQLVTTEPVSLADIIPFGGFSVADAYDQPAIGQAAGSQRAAAAQETTSGSFSPGGLASCDGGETVAYEAGLGFEPSFSFSASWNLWTGPDVSLGVQGTANATLSFSDTWEGACEGEAATPSVGRPPIVFFVGSIPVVIEPQLGVTFSFEASASATVELSASATFTASAAIGLRRGDPFADFAADRNGAADASIQGTGSLQIEAEPKLDLKAYGALTGSVSLGAFVEGRFKTGSDLSACYQIDAGLEGEADLSMSKWGLDFSHEVLDAEIVRFTLASTTPPCDIAITTAKLPKGFVGQAYDAAIEAGSYVPPVQWELAAGQLPLGLAFDQNGEAARIHGIPVVGTTSPVHLRVRVTDSTGATDERTLVLRIGAPGAIVYDDGEGRIWTVKPDGTDSYRVSPPGWFLFEPLWAPDRSVIFAYGRTPLESSPTFLVAMSPDGRWIRRLDDDVDDVGAKVSSPFDEPGVLIFKAPNLWHLNAKGESFPVGSLPSDGVTNCWPLDSLNAGGRRLVAVHCISFTGSTVTMSDLDDEGYAYTNQLDGKTAEISGTGECIALLARTGQSIMIERTSPDSSCQPRQFNLAQGVLDIAWGPDPGSLVGTASGLVLIDAEDGSQQTLVEGSYEQNIDWR